MSNFEKQKNDQLQEYNTKRELAWAVARVGAIAAAQYTAQQVSTNFQGHTYVYTTQAYANAADAALDIQRTWKGGIERIYDFPITIEEFAANPESQEAIISFMDGAVDMRMRLGWGEGLLAQDGVHIDLTDAFRSSADGYLSQYDAVRAVLEKVMQSGVSSLTDEDRSSFYMNAGVVQDIYILYSEGYRSEDLDTIVSHSAGRLYFNSLVHQNAEFLINSAYLATVLLLVSLLASGRKLWRSKKLGSRRIHSVNNGERVRSQEGEALVLENDLSDDGLVETGFNQQEEFLFLGDSSES